MGSTATAARGGDQPHPRAVVPFRPNPQFAELVRLSPMSIADEIREERGCRLRNGPGGSEPSRNHDDHLFVIWLCRGCHLDRHENDPTS